MAIPVSPNDTADAAGSGAGDWNETRNLRRIAFRRQTGRADSRRNRWQADALPG